MCTKFIVCFKSFDIYMSCVQPFDDVRSNTLCFAVCCAANGTFFLSKMRWCIQLASQDIFSPPENVCSHSDSLALYLFTYIMSGI